MHTRFLSRRTLTVLVPAACALVLSASQGSAQGYGRLPDQGPAYADQTETVEVSRPRVHFREDRLGRLPEKVTESTRLQMSARELRTSWGAYEMKVRVRDAARDICSDLGEHIPFAYDTRRSCYRDAVFNGMRSADAAIERARYEGE